MGERCGGGRLGREESSMADGGVGVEASGKSFPSELSCPGPQ